MTSSTEPRADLPLLTVADYTERARRVLSREVWDFVAGGAGQERTLAANETAFDALCLRTRTLTGIIEPDTSVRVWGRTWGAPLGVAPVAYHELAHSDGESGTAQAAGGLGLPVVVSTFASQAVERIAAAATAPLWLQLYCFRDWSTTASLALRARDAGYQALVVTVDAPYTGRRLRDVRNGFRVPPHVLPVNLLGTGGSGPGAATDAPGEHSRMTFDRTLDWSVMRRLRELTGLPVLAKGVLTAEDARAAVDAGVDGVMVSNHGGRQLDGVPATVEVLPEVVAAVDGRCPVFLDGGVRRGSDVFVALALGATAVFVGRPALYGLAAAGAAGAHAVLALLLAELSETMLFTGRGTVGAVDGSAVAVRGAGWLSGVGGPGLLRESDG